MTFVSGASTCHASYHTAVLVIRSHLLMGRDHNHNERVYTWRTTNGSLLFMSQRSSKKHCLHMVRGVCVWLFTSGVWNSFRTMDLDVLGNATNTTVEQWLGQTYVHDVL